MALSLIATLGAASARAQAWLSPKGEASFTFGLVSDFADHHLDYRGNPVSPGDMTWHNVISDLSYGVTDRLGVRLRLPYVISHYDGRFPHPARPGFQNPDDGTWHRAFQDLRAEVRFRATEGALAVTPFVAFGTPTSSYATLGHAAAGRGLAEAQVGVSAGRTLDPVVPNAYLQARYTFAVPEKVLGIWHNRSTVLFDLGYFVTPALTVNVVGAWEKTHGGWRAPLDFPPPSDPRFVHHDQLTRTEYWRMGGGVSYALTGSLDIALNGYASLSARNDVNMKGLGLAFTYSFSPAQVLKKRKGPEPSSP